MADTITTTGQIDPAVDAMYDRTLLERALPYLVHDRFGQRRPLKSNSGRTVKFRKFSALPTNTVPLQEGVTPAGQQLSKTDITATVQQYGDFVTVTDVVTWVNEDSVLMETAELLGEQAGQTLDLIYRDRLVGGTNVMYANNVAARGNITGAATGIANEKDLKWAVRTLVRANTRKWTSMIRPGTGVGSTPIRPAYWAITHPDVVTDLEDFSTLWTPVEKYAAQTQVMEHEVGAFSRGVRFVETTNAKIWPNAGGADGNVLVSTGGTLCDVYATLIYARDAYGIVPLEGHAMENIRKPLGSAGAADPLNQRGTSGWKAMTTARILQELFMIRYETGASDFANL